MASVSLDSNWSLVGVQSLPNISPWSLDRVGWTWLDLGWSPIGVGWGGLDLVGVHWVSTGLQWTPAPPGWISNGVAGLQWSPIRQVGECEVLYQGFAHESWTPLRGSPIFRPIAAFMRLFVTAGCMYRRNPLCIS